MALTKVVAAGISTGGNVEFSNIISGVVTSTTFSGGSLNVTGDISGNSLNVTGVITATSFVGDISQATGAAAGLGTALSQDQSNPLNKIYYTDTILSIGSTQTVNPPDSSNIAYTQYAEIAVEEGFDLIVEDGDDLVPDILGLSTETAGVLAGAGGRVRADNFTNKAGTGAPTFPNGVNVTGVLTATSFSGDGSALTGIDATSLKDSGDTIRVQANTSGAVVTGVLTATSFSGNATGLSGTPNLNVGVLTATSFSGDGSALTGIAVTSVTGNLTVTSGNLILSDGNGIDFSADGNADGMSSELLDDYEEGTYTPVLSGGGYTYTSGSYTEGRYTKVGRLVTVEAHYNINAISGSSDGSPTRITLPFAPSDLYTAGRWCQVLCRLVYFNSSAIQRVYCAQLTTNSSSADIVYYYTSSGSGTDQPVNIGADWQSASSNGQIAFVMTYVTAS